MTFLKNGFRLFLKTLVITAFCITLFVGVGYYYLSKNLKQTDTDTPQKVPYYQEAPQNAGILLDVFGDKIFLYFDFENTKITASLFLEQSDIKEKEIYGYPLDYTLQADMDFITDLVDYINGIELNLENETLRYTGVQVTDIILKDTKKEYKKDITKAIISQIAKNGIGNDLLLRIVEKGETNITVPDFYYWSKFLGQSAGNLHIIDG